MRIRPQTYLKVRIIGGERQRQHVLSCFVCLLGKTMVSKCVILDPPDSPKGPNRWLGMEPQQLLTWNSLPDVPRGSWHRYERNTIRYYIGAPGPTTNGATRASLRTERSGPDAMCPAQCAAEMIDSSDLDDFIWTFIQPPKRPGSFRDGWFVLVRTTGLVFRTWSKPLNQLVNSQNHMGWRPMGLEHVPLSWDGLKMGG